MQRNAEICRDMQGNIGKCKEMLRNAEKIRTSGHAHPQEGILVWRIGTILKYWAPHYHMI